MKEQFLYFVEFVSNKIHTVKNKSNPLCKSMSSDGRPLKVNYFININLLTQLSNFMFLVISNVISIDRPRLWLELSNAVWEKNERFTKVISLHISYFNNRSVVDSTTNEAFNIHLYFSFFLLPNQSALLRDPLSYATFSYREIAEEIAEDSSYLSMLISPRLCPKLY